MSPQCKDWPVSISQASCARHLSRDVMVGTLLIALVSCHKPHGAAKQNTKEKTTVIEHFIQKFAVQRDVDWSPAQPHGSPGRETLGPNVWRGSQVAAQETGGELDSLTRRAVSWRAEFESVSRNANDGLHLCDT